MKALIIEDELMAQRSLLRMLNEHFPDIEVIGTTSSVADSVAWLKANSCDIIFMDVELSDGRCFKIFKSVDIHAKVIMTTAYDNYAVKAFEVNSIDYLLKPIELPDLERAIGRCRETVNRPDMEKLIQTLGNLGSAPKSSYKERFLVHSGERIIPVDTDKIACFVSENKGTYLVNNEGTRYIISSSLDEIQPQLDPKAFFRISRSAIIAKKAVDTIEKLGSSRLTVITPGTGAFDVSRARGEDFLIWLEK